MTMRYLKCLLGLVFMAKTAGAQNIRLISEANHSSPACLNLKLKTLVEDKNQAIIFDGLSNDHPLREAQFKAYTDKLQKVLGIQNTNIPFQKRFYGLEPHTTYTLRGIVAFSYQILFDIKMFETYSLDLASVPIDENPASSALKGIKSSINDEAQILENIVAQSEAALKLFQDMSGEVSFVVPRLGSYESVRSLGSLKNKMEFILGSYIEKLHELFSINDPDLLLTSEDEDYIQQKEDIKKADPYMLQFYLYNDYLENRYLEKYIPKLVEKIISTKLNNIVIFSGRTHVESIKKGLANLKNIKIIDYVCK